MVLRVVLSFQKAFAQKKTFQRHGFYIVVRSSKLTSM